MSVRRYKMAGLRAVVAGLVIIALDIFALQAVRMLRTWSLAEFGYLAVLWIGWLIILLGAGSISRYHRAFSKTRIASAAVLAVIIIEALMMYSNVRANLGDQAYIEFGVMLMNYITILGMFYAYYRMLQGVSSLAKKNGGTKLALKCDGRGKKSFAVILICLILIPVTSMFDDHIQYAGTGALGLIMLAAQIRMCVLLLSGHDLIRGKEVK